MQLKSHKLQSQSNGLRLFAAAIFTVIRRAQVVLKTVATAITTKTFSKGCSPLGREGEGQNQEGVWRRSLKREERFEAASPALFFIFIFHFQCRPKLFTLARVTFQKFDLIKN